MRFVTVAVVKTIALCLFCLSAVAAADWEPYPSHLPAFTFPGEQLADNWQALTAGVRGPFPSAEAMRADAERWPVLFRKTEALLRTQAANDPVFAVFAEGSLDENLEFYALMLQQVWRLLFEGQFREARDLGLSLGPAGYFPGLYAQALYANYVEPDKKRKLALLNEVIDRTADMLPDAPDHVFIRFGNAYGKSRVMEDMSRGAALGTGYTSEVKQQLESLIAEYPDNIYALTLLGGIHAGIIEKGGRMLARMTFGSRPELMDEYFNRAMKLNDQYPALYYEYATAQLRVHGKDGETKARALLGKAVTFTPNSAEEALQIDASRRMLKLIQ